MRVDKQKWLTECQIPRDTVIVDLDSDRILIESHHSLPPLLPDCMRIVLG